MLLYRDRELKITWPDDTYSSIQGHWDSTWALEYIIINELRTTFFALQFTPETLADHPVIFYSDKASAQWTNKGTSTRSKKDKGEFAYLSGT